MKFPGLPERISALVQACGGNRRELARRLGTWDGTIIGWEGGSDPHPSTLHRIALKSGLSLPWLETGKGDQNEEIARFLERTGEPHRVSGPRGHLAHALSERKLTTAQLAKLIRYDSGVIEQVVNGTARASEAMIEAIVRELPELTKEELMDGGDSPMVLREDGMEGTYGARAQVALPAGMHGRLVPLLSMAQAGGWDADHSDEGWAGEAVFALNVDDRRAFAIRVSGNSMEPEIREGDVVICSPHAEITPGAAAVVRTRSGQAFVKFWRKHGDAVVLESANPAYQPIKFPLAEIAGAWPVVQRIASGMIRKT